MLRREKLLGWCWNLTGNNKIHESQTWVYSMRECLLIKSSASKKSLSSSINVVTLIISRINFTVWPIRCTRSTSPGRMLYGSTNFDLSIFFRGSRVRLPRAFRLASIFRKYEVTYTLSCSISFRYFSWYVWAFMMILKKMKDRHLDNYIKYILYAVIMDFGSSRIFLIYKKIEEKANIIGCTT